MVANRENTLKNHIKKFTKISVWNPNNRYWKEYIIYFRSKIRYEKIAADHEEM